MTAQHIAIGKPVHKGEASGINFLVKHLPATHIVVSNVDLPTGQHGRTFDHDVVVIAPHAIFTVELKSWGGLITGNRDRWMLPGSGYTQSPIPLVLHKARVLKSVLSSFRPSLGRVWVQGLVFVSAPDADLQLSRDFEAHARTRDDVIDALTDPREWGLQGRKLDEEQIRSAVEYLADGHPPSARTHYGEFELIERLPAEDKPYDAFRAKTQFGLHRLIHVYPIQGDNEKTRERARNQALREATLAERISGYQDILGWYGEHQFPHDDTVLLAFEDVTPLLPLSTWITERRPGFEERLQLALRITKALCWMHSRKVIHRRLSPESILLDEGSDKLRLTALDLARDLSGQAATLTASRLRDPSYRCMAPELLKGAQASVGTDLFALGAVFFELILERPLFEKAEDALRPFDIPQLHVSVQRVPADFERLVHRLLSTDPAERPETCSEVVEALSECLRVAKPKRKSGPEPIGPGRVIGPYRLTQRLAEGAGGATWKARHLQEEHDWIAKIADAERSDALRTEQGILQSVKHSNLVGYKDILAVDAGGLMLILSFVEGVTGADWAGAGDPLTPAQLERLGKGLLGAVGALHDAGWVHRDIKPANVMLRANAEPVLIDLGLGTLADDPDQLTVGTVDYKDPNVYQLGRWAPAIDLFAAWLVIYEVATGVHPFGGRPEPDRHPTIDTSLFSEAFETKQLEALASLVEDALHPDLERRPKSAAEGIERLEAVFKASAQASLPLGGEGTPASALLPTDASPEQAVADLALSARAHRALRKKGVSLVGHLVGLPPRAFEGMPNVGNKTRAELERLVDEAKARFPNLGGDTIDPKPARRPRAVLFPDLVGDERPVDELGRALTPKIVQGLTRLGVSSLGELGALDSATLRNIPGVGPKRLGEIIEALERIAGTVRPPADLAELDHALEAELGSAVFGILSQLLGLADGKVRSRREVSDTLGITRQRVEQVADVSDLRKRASVASALVDAVERLLPPAGFARLEDVADTLQAQLPEVEGASALGHARLAAVLLEPERRLLDLERIELICRPPWTPESVKRVVQAVSEKTSWPPLPLHEAADLAWEAVPDEVKGGLRRWGVDARALLAALRPLMTDVLTIQDALFTPPVPFEDALAHQRRNLELPISLSALEAQLQRLYQAVTPPRDRDEALAAQDLALHEGMVQDVAAPPPKPPVIPQVDEGVAHRVSTEDGTLDLGVLVAAAARGGFRVAMLPPGKHHRMVEDLRQALAKELGEDRVHLLDVDRTILETLEHAGLWADAEFFEKKQSDQWGWARPTLVKALEHELEQHAKAGVVTILGRPTLLGPLGLLDWLSGVYDDVRGGQQGLFVLALPGGIHDGRVRLNEKYPFPYTPDMAAVSLLPPAGFRLEPQS